MFAQSLPVLSIKYAYQWAGLVAMLASAGVATRFGGISGAIAGGAMTLAWFLSGIVHRSRLVGLETGVALVDLALFAIVLAIALKSDKWWPMVATAMLGLILTLHLAVLYDGRVLGRSAFVAESIFSYLTMLALAAGSYLERDKSDQRYFTALEPDLRSLQPKHENAPRREQEGVISLGRGPENYSSAGVDSETEATADVFEGLNAS